MKHKLLNFGVIVTSLIGFLEWGKGNSLFLFEAEKDIATKLVTNPTSVLHPFVLMPLLGQILLAITLFQKQPNKYLTYTGISLLAVLLLLMFVIGIISFNYKILLSTLPFIIASIITIIYIKKK
ncbi:MAG: hypothetical protein NTZ59_08605 [Bacteroidetes bacterium]|jgi:hypothetical protein|nr:hypothetical protein [Bacteroidota bacterium]